MTHSLIPPPGLAPPSISHLPLEKKVELWAQLVDVGDALMRAGLRHKVGPDGDIEAAYREWNVRRMENHDRALVRLLENLSRREAGHGC